MSDRNRMDPENRETGDPRQTPAETERTDGAQARPASVPVFRVTEDT